MVKYVYIVRCCVTALTLNRVLTLNTVQTLNIERRPYEQLSLLT